MKKIIILIFTIGIFCACSDKNKTKTTDGVREEVVAPASGYTSEDIAIKDWLVGKEWKAENEAAPFAVLKVFSGDSCGYTTGKYHYTFKNGRLEMFGAEWPFTRINDSTFTIYVKPTQKTYTYHFDRNL